MRPWYQIVPFTQPQHHIIDPANLCGALDDGVKDRLHIRRRSADDTEHLCRRGLMFQRFRCVDPKSLMEFFEEPHILDGDHSLRSESFQERNLLFSKRANLSSGGYP